MCLCAQQFLGKCASMWDCGGVCGSVCVRESLCALMRFSAFVFVVCVVVHVCVCVCECVFVRVHACGLPHGFCMGLTWSKPNL